MNNTQLGHFLLVLAQILDKRGVIDLGGYPGVVAEMIRTGEDFTDELTALTAELQELVDKGLDPSDNQLETVFLRRQELSQRIRAQDPEK